MREAQAFMSDVDEMVDSNANVADHFEPVGGSAGASSSMGAPQDTNAYFSTTEDALALEFTRRHGATLRYVAAWGRWLQWNGERWKSEETHLAFDLARKVARERGMACHNAAALNAKTVAAIERLARADRVHACSTDIWDKEPWLLNTKGGIVDLKTGKTRPHDPRCNMTKITAVAPNGDCPQWLRFLEQITRGKEGLAAFLQRVAGYCLTGSTREHALFFCYGAGGNGKSVFINTLGSILGDYAATSGMETFMASNNDRHTTELARLRGTRFVSAQEVDEGRHWNESRIKALSGGDPITARFMRQDEFTFTPEFKLLFAGNHKPSLRSVDEAMRRRLRLIPFAVTIPPGERNHNLFEELKAEWPGILQWAIKGCLEWQRVGLKQPPCVTDATDAYLDAQDNVSQWLDECFDAGEGFRASRTELASSWQDWCKRSGENPGSRGVLYDKIEQLGLTACKIGGDRGFKGVRVKQ